MRYRAIGLMSGSSLDGLDIVFAEFSEQGGAWSFEIGASACYPYVDGWATRLEKATEISAREYQQLHIDYGHYLGREVNRFIEEFGLQYKVALLASHGHTVFHDPAGKMTAQLGDGASIAAETELPVVSDLRSLDIALGGQGAPIVPIGEKLLLGDYDFFLNLGGIANISVNRDPYIAFDICPANRVLNMLAGDVGKAYDEGGAIAATGKINVSLLRQLDSLDYYRRSFPKSLANEFGTGIIFPLIIKSGLSTADALRTYTEHIVLQISRSVFDLIHDNPGPFRMLVSGGGALNTFLVSRLQQVLESCRTEAHVPDVQLVQFKEALIMAFIGVLRWRQEYNVLSSVTGARRNSIGGALWSGQEA